MSKSFINVWVHFVWTTKNREPLLHKDLKIKLCKHILEQAEDKGHQIDFINGVEDHLHCLVKMKSSVTISKVINDIKGESSRWINENNLVEGVFSWQAGYGAFSVSPQNVETVRNYIRNQEKHHQEKDFGAEMKFFEKFDYLL